METLFSNDRRAELSHFLRVRNQQFEFWDGNAYQYSNRNYSFNTWHHGAYVYDGSDIHFYLDGQPAGSAGAGHSGADAHLVMRYMASREGNDRWWPGNLSDVRAYDTDLSDLQINDLYNGKNITDNLEGHWPIREGEDGTINGYDIEDISGNENHGNNEGATWSLDSNPAIWQNATSDAPIPGVEAGDDLSGRYLWVWQELSTEAPATTPRLESLSVMLTGAPHHVTIEGPQSLIAGRIAGPFTITVRDRRGRETSLAEERELKLVSTSGGYATFYGDAEGEVDLEGSITIPGWESRARFYYRDISAGEPPALSVEWKQ